MVRDNKFNFTKERLSKIEIPKRGDKFYMDIQARGLGLRVSYGGSKIFYLCKKISNKLYKRKIGHMDDWSIEEARNKCNELRREIERTTSTDSNQSLVNEITLRELLDKYINDYAVYNNQPYSIEETKRRITKYAKPLLDIKLSMITKEEVSSYFIKSTRNGIYTANKLIQSLRAIFNKGIEWSLCDKNPCIGIKKHKEKSRDRYIEVEEINAFLKSLEEEPDEMARNFFCLCLYTGLRKSVLLSLPWKNVRFESKTLYIPSNKNKKDLEEGEKGEKSGSPHIILLVDEAIEILEKIKKNNETKWVFPSNGIIKSKSGHYEEPKKAWKRILKRAEIKDLRIHDLRRTLGSWMANNGESLHIIGEALNHKSASSTGIYSRLNINSVKKGMERAVNNMYSKNKETSELSTQELIEYLRKQNIESSKQIEELKKQNEKLKKQVEELKK